jgi:hypothetical protein
MIDNNNCLNYFKKRRMQICFLNRRANSVVILFLPADIYTGAEQVEIPVCIFS